TLEKVDIDDDEGVPGVEAFRKGIEEMLPVGNSSQHIVICKSDKLLFGSFQTMSLFPRATLSFC
ncbi:hypothetical protein ACC754_37455, partial [Rhizobium johnstonii]